MAVLAPIHRRARRLLRALRASVEPSELEALSAHLNPAQLRLFQAMQPADQRHSLEVFGRLLRGGYRDPDLLQAALLHDVGKARARLRLWHRVVIDLGRSFSPGLLRWLARRAPSGLGHPLSVALHHPELGAQDALSVGCSARVAALIRGTGGPELADLAEALRHCDAEA